MPPLMLGVATETQGADFPLHWMQVISQLFPRKAIEGCEGTFSVHEDAEMQKFPKKSVGHFVFLVCFLF